MLSKAKPHSGGRRSRRWRRVWSVAVVAMVSVCAVACGSSRPQEPGGLTGAIRFRGGPSEAVIRQRQGGQIRLVRAHKVFASVRVRPGQRFRLSVPAGTYELQARSGDALCRHTAVTLHAGAMAQVDAICDVR
jgi:hypothetical protein